MPNKIIVAGIGPGGEEFITPAALEKIRATKFLIGGRRALSTFARGEQLTCPITRDLDAPLNFIRDKLPLGNVVVMVSGDPGYYSLLDRLRKNFPPSTIEVIPSISAIQLAFARLALPWHDATLLSFHGRQPARATLQFAAGKILGLLTDAEHNSATISRLLIDCGWNGDSLVTVCDRLSYPDEKIFTTTLDTAAEADAVCNCVLIVRGAENFTGTTKNFVDDNIRRLLEIFPNCATEIPDADGNIQRGVNFDMLRQMLGSRLVDGREAFVFDFVGKKRAVLEAHTPIRKTLRPVREKSRDFDSTRNIYIEGDNLDALKLLQEGYLGKVKLIYIDPPYNTGNDFIYRDDFRILADAFDDAAGNFDADGNRLRANPSSGGRFHSDWCAMIYSRLLLAKNFLASDGAIFISIDDHEQANLKKICDEIFGEKNFVGNLIWESTTQPTNAGAAKFGLQKKTEHILLYAKNKFELKGFRLEEVSSTPTYPHKGRFGACRFEIIEKSDAGNYKRQSMKFKILGQYPREGRRWQIGEKTARQLEAAGRVEIVDGIVKKAVYPEDELDSRQYAPFWSLLTANVVGTAQVGKDELNTLMGTSLGFDTVKPTRLIKKILQLATDGESIIMDFFSGSATTAQAVMELNAQDGGRRQYIMIQLAEATADNSEARRAGYATICDIGQERIRRAGDKLKSANPDMDAGFRVFKVDESNFIEPPAVWTREIVLDYVENIKPDRDAWDLLFGALIERGLTIDCPVASETICGVEVLIYGGEIMACFAANVGEDLIHELAARRPSKTFFRDASFATSADKLNALEYFRQFAPDTEVDVL